MSGETEADVSGWTTDTLRAHLLRLMDERDRRYEQRFDAQQAAVQAALESAKDAVNKAETAAEKRFDSVNEFRAQLADQTATLLPRREYEAEHTALELRVDKVERFQFEGAGRLAAIPWLIGAASALIAVGSLIFAATR